AWISADVDSTGDFDPRICSKGVAISAQPVFQVRHRWNRENDYVAFAMKLLRSHFSPDDARMVIVRSDEQQSPAAGRVRVHCYHWDPLGDRGIDICFHQFGICDRDQNAAWLRFHDLLKFQLLSFGIISFRADKFRLQIELFRSLEETCTCDLPVRQSNLG